MGLKEIMIAGAGLACGLIVGGVFMVYFIGWGMFRRW